MIQRSARTAVKRTRYSAVKKIAPAATTHQLLDPYTAVLYTYMYSCRHIYSYGIRTILHLLQLYSCTAVY